MNKTVVGLIVAVVIIAGGAWYMNPKISNEVADGAAENSQPAVREFTVNGNNFTFDVTNMTVNEGERVKIIFNNVEGIHDLKIDEFNAATKQLQAGQSETIEFVADKKGNFEYYCSVGKHREMGMKGTLIVQ